MGKLNLAYRFCFVLGIAFSIPSYCLGAEDPGTEYCGLPLIIFTDSSLTVSGSALKNGHVNYYNNSKIYARDQIKFAKAASFSWATSNGSYLPGLKIASNERDVLGKLETNMGNSSLDTSRRDCINRAWGTLATTTQYFKIDSADYRRIDAAVLQCFADVSSAGIYACGLEKHYREGFL